ASNPLRNDFVTPSASQRRSVQSVAAGSRSHIEEAMPHDLCQAPPAIAAATLSAMLATSAAAQPRLPRLRYEPPADLLHSALGPPENYESTSITASLQLSAVTRRE